MHGVDIEAAAEIHHGAFSENALHLQLSAFLFSQNGLCPPVDPAFFDAFLFELNNCIFRVFFFQPDNGTIDILRKIRNATQAIFVWAIRQINHISPLSSPRQFVYRQFHGRFGLIGDDGKAIIIPE